MDLLQALRARYPEYEDAQDADLAEALRQHYLDDRMKKAHLRSAGQASRAMSASAAADLSRPSRPAEPDLADRTVETGKKIVANLLNPFSLPEDQPGSVERVARQFGGGALEGPRSFLAGTGEFLDIGQRNLEKALKRLLLPTPSTGGSMDDITLGMPQIGEGWRKGGELIKDLANNKVMLPVDQRAAFDNAVAGLGQMGGEALTDGLTFGGSAFARGVDSMAERVKNDSASQEDKDAAMLIGGLVTGAISRVGFEKALQWAPVEKALSKPIVRSVAHIGEAAASKGVQGASEEILHDVTRKMATNKDAPIDWDKALYKGAINAVAGAVSRGAGEAFAHMRSRGGSGEPPRQAGDAGPARAPKPKAKKGRARDNETVSSVNAAEAVEAIAPDAPVLRRRNGGVVVRAGSEARRRAGQSRQGAAYADSDAIGKDAAGLGAVLAGIEVMPLPSGNVIVTGENAAEVVKAIAPEAPVLRRKDGAVMVSARFSEPVFRAIDEARRVLCARSGDAGGLAAYSAAVSAGGGVCPRYIRSRANPPSSRSKGSIKTSRRDSFPGAFALQHKSCQ